MWDRLEMDEGSFGIYDRLCLRRTYLHQQMLDIVLSN